MSIIIRLQNLPWEANSQDIRRFFVNLSIPEGGVHIVGGDKGDAFIAFASDEDARQAMARDGQEIKGIRVKLFLSSKAEMAKTVEQARQAHLALTSKPPVVVSPTPIAAKEVAPFNKQQDPQIEDTGRRRSRSRSRDRRRSRSRDRKRRSRSPPRRRNKSNERNRGPTRNMRGRQGRSRSPSPRSRFDRPNNGGPRNGRDGENILQDASHPRETPVWEPGMQPGMSSGPNSAPFLGLPTDMTAGLSNLLQGIQGTLPVNPLVVAQALVQNGLQDNPVNPTLPKALNPLLKLALNPTLAALKGPLLPTPDNSTNGDTPPALGKALYPTLHNNQSNIMNGNGISKPLCFRVSGFTELPNYFDIRHFFFGVLLRDGCIKYSWEGMRPVILINVENEDDARIVGRLDGELYASYYNLRIEPIDRIEFLKHQDFYPNSPHQMEALRFVPYGRGPVLGGRAMPNLQDLVLAIIDVPAGTSEMRIRDVFAPIRCSEVVLDFRSGHPRGNCLVRFSYPSDFEQALERSGSFLDQTKVEILPVNQKCFDEAKQRNRQYNQSSGDGQSRIRKKSRFSSVDEPNLKPRADIDPAKTVLSIENLPFDIVDRQLGEFCAESGVICQSVHLKNGSNPSESSRAFVECQNAEDAATMASKTGMNYYGFKLKILAVTPAFMRTMMGVPAAPLAPPFGVPMMRPPFEMQGMSNAPFGGRGRSQGGRGGGGRNSYAPMPSPALTDSLPGHHLNGPNQPMGNHDPSPTNSTGDPFANPLCVVSICNLNYTAGVDDLINVFRDYNIRKDLIMRRYNDQNQPTGDARVAFASPKDASEAVQRFNGTNLLGRTLRLSLLGR